MKGATSSGENRREPVEIRVQARLDAGEQNCATLILNVRQAMQKLTGGAVLAVRAYDPSAHLDLQAWCRLTGHEFLKATESSDATTYYLRKGTT